MRLASTATILLALVACVSCGDSEESGESPCKAPMLNAVTALATVEGQPGVPITKMIFIDPGPAPVPASFKPITFSAEVQSEDRDQPLVARVFVDFQIAPNPLVGGGDVLAPSTCSDVRTITAQLGPFQLAQTGGCHQVALVVTHSFDSKTFQPTSPADTALLVWWMLIEHEPSSSPAATCPPGAPPPGDAGG